MAETLATMSKEELREMIETAVENKLMELFGDPDTGLKMRKKVRDQLHRQTKAVAQGDRGNEFAQVVKRLGLE
ncbi:MAG TPA: hypothetical protein VL475_01430 [Planctomycetaceae bacterium]|jgi:hypothetical protein|nr:hypothetical protein [Planctomycetaceae bacterium]